MEFIESLEIEIEWKICRNDVIIKQKDIILRPVFCLQFQTLNPKKEIKKNKRRNHGTR